MENTTATFTSSVYDHKLVEVALKGQVDRTLGSYLLTLREDRNAADYNLDNPAVFRTENGTQRSLFFDINDQRESIQLADKIISRLVRT